MARVTSKLQVTIPKAVAVEFGIVPGSEIDFVPAGDMIRVRPASASKIDVSTRLARFDRATERQRRRQAVAPKSTARGRGWAREELYERGRPR